MVEILLAVAFLSGDATDSTARQSDNAVFEARTRALRAERKQRLEKARGQHVKRMRADSRYRARLRSQAYSQAANAANMATIAHARINYQGMVALGLQRPPNCYGGRR